MGIDPQPLSPSSSNWACVYLHSHETLIDRYALWYNRKYHRHGHVFQNRFKSILCQEDAYLLELVRYIHLNPLRARLVENIDELGYLFHLSAIPLLVDRRLQREKGSFCWKLKNLTASLFFTVPGEPLNFSCLNQYARAFIKSSNCRRLMNICLLLPFLTIFVNCEKGIDYMIKDVSQIKISGGCEVFAEGCITFVPLGKDKTTVRVDNSGRYFCDENADSIPSFEIKVYAEQLSKFIGSWIELMDSVQKKTDYFSTRNATVLFDFSLQDGKVHFSLSENQGGYQLDPIIESIEAFVVTCQKKVKPPTPTSSKPLFSAKNKTEEFLGSPDEREKVILQFNDINGLHGGNVIVVNGWAMP